MKYVAFLALFVISSALAKPIAYARTQDIVITLTDEPCELAAVVNLPHKATWEEKGKTFQGCWGLNASLVATYFDDKTVAVIPAEVFQKATEV